MLKRQKLPENKT